MKSSAHQVTLRELMPLCPRQDLVIVFQYNPFSRRTSISGITTRRDMLKCYGCLVIEK